MTNTFENDRNFDTIADHFAKKVYGGLKGKIRLAVLTQDINSIIQDLAKERQNPLNILDVGAGLAQISLSLAKKHHVTINDISTNMLAKAQQNAQELVINPSHLSFIHAPYQHLSAQLSGQKFDLILCHAVLEWLDNPEQIMDFFDEFLSQTGVLSLCFYNPASLIYRNLIMGNFYQLDTPKAADNKSLTPNHPVSYEQVQTWLKQHHYTTLSWSGIRVFWDYTPIKRGGLNNEDEVIKMELRHAHTAPFWQMGRYLHVCAKKCL